MDEPELLEDDHMPRNRGIASRAMATALTARSIQASFKATGICPLNPYHQYGASQCFSEVPENKHQSASHQIVENFIGNAGLPAVLAGTQLLDEADVNVSVECPRHDLPSVNHNFTMVKHPGDEPPSKHEDVTMLTRSGDQLPSERRSVVVAGLLPTCPPTLLGFARAPRSTTFKVPSGTIVHQSGHLEFLARRRAKVESPLRAQEEKRAMMRLKREARDAEKLVKAREKAERAEVRCRKKAEQDAEKARWATMTPGEKKDERRRRRKAKRASALHDDEPLEDFASGLASWKDRNDDLLNIDEQE